MLTIASTLASLLTSVGANEDGAKGVGWRSEVALHMRTTVSPGARRYMASDAVRYADRACFERANDVYLSCTSVRAANRELSHALPG